MRLDRLPPLLFAACALLGVVACLGPGTLENDCAKSGQEVIQNACLGCHSSSLTGEARADAPEGADFDTEEAVQTYADIIRERALETKDMPPAGPLSECDQQTLDAYLDSLPDAF